jgi:hypothetical protein
MDRRLRFQGGFFHLPHSGHPSLEPRCQNTQSASNESCPTLIADTYPGRVFPIFRFVAAGRGSWECSPGLQIQGRLVLGPRFPVINSHSATAKQGRAYDLTCNFPTWAGNEREGKKEKTNCLTLRLASRPLGRLSLRAFTIRPVFVLLHLLHSPLVSLKIHL